MRDINNFLLSQPMVSLKIYEISVIFGVKAPNFDTFYWSFICMFYIHDLVFQAGGEKWEEERTKGIERRKYQIWQKINLNAEKPPKKMGQPAQSYIYSNKSPFISAGAKQQHSFIFWHRWLQDDIYQKNNKKAHLSQNKYLKIQWSGPVTATKIIFYVVFFFFLSHFLTKQPAIHLWALLRWACHKSHLYF